MTHFPVTGLSSVGFVVPDLDAAADFYVGAWGLVVADRRADRIWLRGTGSDPYLVTLHSGAAPAIASMTLRCAADTDPAALVAAMVARGATVAHEERAVDAPGGGRATAVRDPQGRMIRLLQGDAPAERLTPAPDRPERLSHVNFNSDDVERDAAFLTEALGFRLTDRSKMMAFCRTNSDHHAIVIAQATVNTLNHVAFELAGWEGVMRASGRMVDGGFPIGWGPGRHGPGNNVFAYFVNPDGFVVEYTAEMLQVDDGYRVGMPDDWTWPAGRTDHWGIAPPKADWCKTAQLAIPFA